MPTTSALNDLLAHATPHAQHDEVLGHDQRFQVLSYLTQKLPPLEFITSVRVIVLQLGQPLSVLTFCDEEDQVHVVPGGRRETDETLEQTGRREVLEETGWELDTLRLLGFWHFRRLTEVPPNYPYPLHFAQAIYTALALEHRPDHMQQDDYVTSSRFISKDEADQLVLSAGEQMFLNEAIRFRKTN